MFLSIGFVGLVGMTWLFPCLAALYWRLDRRRSSAGPQNVADSSSTRKISILIPAHNEQQSLTGTLDSIVRSISAAKLSFPSVTFNIRVGLDGCTDKTEQIASDFGCDLISSVSSRGKWSTLKSLVERSLTSDYVIFADAGVIWPDDFLSQTLTKITHTEPVALAPTYRNPSMGRVESLFWSVERCLKDLEGRSGGPISVHGATVVYKTQALVEALRELGSGAWLNDDVVIPLTLRALNPSREVLYCSEIGVSDSAQAIARNVDGKEFGRRQRMVIGNVQWMRRISPMLWKSSVAIGLLSLRRVFRVFWAYWGLAFALAFAVLLAQVAGPQGLLILGIVAFGAAIVASHRFAFIRRGFDAAGASLMAPYYLFTLSSSKEAVWD